MSVVLIGCETLSFSLREEHRPRGFENRVLRRIFTSKMEEENRGENCIMINLIAWILHLILLG
jgi:hypothetical protein